MVDLKLALYTKTWTWMNWLGIVVFSVVIYIGFIWLGDFLFFFNSFKTARSVFSSWQFLLTVFWSSVMIYAFDMILLILDKELYTPLSTFFSSIVRRRKEHEEQIFERVVEVFKEKKSGPNVN